MDDRIREKKPISCPLRLRVTSGCVGGVCFDHEWCFLSTVLGDASVNLHFKESGEKYFLGKVKCSVCNQWANFSIKTGKPVKGIRRRSHNSQLCF